MNNYPIIYIFCMAVFGLYACSDKSSNPSTDLAEVVLHIDNRPPHPYGGWYCPDNIFGFPPVDFEEWEEVNVISDRLPTKSETQSGASLIFVDTLTYPSAKPIDIKLPRLAKYFSKYTRKNEWIIVIQAIAIGTDSIAGFRYLNGGNGSSWLDEIQFTPPEELDRINLGKYVQSNITIDTTAYKVWDVLTDPSLTESLGNMLDFNTFETIDHDQKNSYSAFHPAGTLNKPILSALWDPFYIQVDYNEEGNQSVKKLLLMPNESKNAVTLHIIAGPYEDNYMDKKIIWDAWIEKVKHMSE